MTRTVEWDVVALDSVNTDFLFYVAIVTTGVFIFLFLVERIVPLRSLKQPLYKRLFINFCVTALAFAANAAFVQPTARFMMQSQ